MLIYSLKVQLVVFIVSMQVFSQFQFSNAMSSLVKSTQKIRFYRWRYPINSSFKCQGYERNPSFGIMNHSRVLLCHLSNGKDDKVVADKVQKDESLKGKFKDLWKKYGLLSIGTYLSIYVMTLGSIFTALDYDIFNAATFGFDAVELVSKACKIIGNLTGTDSLPNYIDNHPKCKLFYMIHILPFLIYVYSRVVGTLAVAWILTKFTEPLRFGFTLAILPAISKLLGKYNTLDNIHSKDS